MKFRTCERCRFLPGSELPCSGAHVVTSCRKSNAKRTLWTWGTRTWAYREDNDCFEIVWGTSIEWSWHQALCRDWLYWTASSSSWTKNYEDEFFLLLGKFWKERRHLQWVIISRYHQLHIQIFCREARQQLHDALSSSCCLLLVWINVFEHPDSSFNSFRFPLSNSKPSQPTTRAQV